MEPKSAPFLKCSEVFVKPLAGAAARVVAAVGLARRYPAENIVGCISWI
jgi:hypothetical protein